MLISEGQQWKVYSPCSEAGTTFIEGLTGNDEHQRDKLIALLDRVAQLGPRSIPQDRNHLVDAKSKLLQFRVDHLRVIWFYDEGHVVICAHLYTKRQAKAPAGEIDAARGIRDEYFAAKQKKNLIYLKPKS